MISMQNVLLTVSQWVHSALYLFDKLLFKLNWLVIARYVPGNDNRFTFDYERHSF